MSHPNTTAAVGASAVPTTAAAGTAAGPRVGIGGIAIESSTFSPHHATMADFTIVEGSAMATRYPFMPDWQFPGYPATQWAPCYHARAIPGGSVARTTYDQLKAGLLAAVRANLPLDGFYFDIHGAMNVVGMDDAEADLAAAIRALVGPDCVIAAGMDLHGNVSAPLVELVDVFTAYRLAPHDDAVETRERTCRLLLGCLAAGRRPVRAWVYVPVMLPGERTSTLVDPGKSLFARLEEWSREPGVLDASLWVGYVWADEPRTGATVVVTGTDSVAVARLAQTIGAEYWRLRHDFEFGTPAGSADWCIDHACTLPDGPVVISDSGDNPTAGGVGDVPYVLERLLANDALARLPAGASGRALYASIPDAAAVAQCLESRSGDRLQVTLGGNLDTINGRPLTVAAELLSINYDDPVGGTIIVLRSGPVDIILTSRRKPYHYRHDFARLGLDPAAYKIVVVKIGYLVPELRAMARHALLALSPGSVNQDIPALPYRRVVRPIFPLDAGMADPPLQAQVFGAAGS